MTRFTRIFAVSALATALLAVAACGSSSPSGSMPGMGSTSMHAESPGAMGSGMSSGPSGMPGMGDTDMYTGTGLAASASGFTLKPTTTTLAADAKTTFAFAIQDGTGMPVKDFADDQTKLMHFYLIRADLTGFLHLHPTMATDGTWSAPVQPLQAGSWRAYASFIAKDASGKQVPLVLSTRVTVGTGSAATQPLPPAAKTTQVDGYTLTLGGEAMMANMTHTLTVTVTKDGKPVSDLQPYLATYAHLTAFHQDDLAFAHLHPQGQANGDHGGPTLTFQAMLAKAGTWRLFIQFQTAATLHTAAITVTVG